MTRPWSVSSALRLPNGAESNSLPSIPQGCPLAVCRSCQRPCPFDSDGTVVVGSWQLYNPSGLPTFALGIVEIKGAFSRYLAATYTFKILATSDISIVKLVFETQLDVALPNHAPWLSHKNRDACRYKPSPPQWSSLLDPALARPRTRPSKTNLKPSKCSCGKGESPPGHARKRVLGNDQTRQRKSEN